MSRYQEIHLYLGDCRERSAELREQYGDGYLDAVVTDPPYEIAFMNRQWDSSGVAFDPDTWEEVFKAVKPGGIIKVFGATKTFHRLCAAIERAGFVDLRIEAWVQAQGMPKGKNISKAIDKKLGAKRKMKRIPMNDNSSVWMQNSGGVGGNTRPWQDRAKEKGYHEVPSNEPVTEEAKKWQGWHTGLKPAWEPFVIATRP